MFESFCDDLVPDDTNGRTDVFVRDRVTQTTELVSRHSDGQFTEDSSGGSISADGRYIVFICNEELAPGGARGIVLLRDRVERRTSLISVGWGGSEPNGPSSQAVISADGQFIAFTSGASNLVPGDDNAASDVFIFDREGYLIEWLPEADTPSLSADGRFVAFSSISSFLAPDDFNDCYDVFVFDRETRTFELLSRNPGGEPALDTPTPRPSAPTAGTWLSHPTPPSSRPGALAKSQISTCTIERPRQFAVSALRRTAQRQVAAGRS